MKHDASVLPEQNFQTGHSSKILWERQGILGWWLNLTAPPRPQEMSSLQVRERVRKSELISLVSAFVAAFLLALLSNSLSDPSTAVAAIIMGIALTVALIFNRLGKIQLAAYIVIIFMLFVVAISLIFAKGGLRLIWFTTFDLFTVPVFLSSLIIRRRASLYCAVITAVFVIVYYIYEPHALLNGFGAHNFDELLYEVNQPYFSWYALINRNVALIIFSGIFGWLAALSFESALEWAEQSRSEASVATALAKYKAQSEQGLILFLQETTQAFAAQANGHMQLIRDRPLTDPLHDAVIFLNAQLRRMESVRKLQTTSPASQVLREIKRLTDLIDEIMAGATMVQYLNPGPGRFYSTYDEVNATAKKLYEIICLMARNR